MRSRLLLGGLLLTLAISVLVDPAPTAAASGVGPSLVMLVMDVSDSMNEADSDGAVKLEGAKRAVTALLDGLPIGVHVGLRTYPAPGSDCNSGELQADVFSDRAVVEQKARGITADGGTPTAAALKAAAEDVKAAGFSDGRGTIVLVSDGESNCDSPPCDVARKIAADGIGITVNTVGFKISHAGASELQCIADVTGGAYRDVQDASQLSETLGALAASGAELTVSAPSTVQRSVGRGTSESVTVNARVTNTSPSDARNLRLQIIATSTAKPFVYNPVRQIGNLAASDSNEVDWTFTLPLAFTNTTIEFDVLLSGDNIASQSDHVAIDVVGEVSLADAGPMLSDKERVVILGDSYSAGEGAGTYIPGYDTNTNPCHRSMETYGKALWGNNRTILACSGAVMDDFYRSQHPKSQPATPPQLDQLRNLKTAPDLAVMSIGGNDAHFADIILACLGPGNCQDKRMISEIECTPRNNPPSPRPLVPGEVRPGPLDPAVQRELYDDLGLSETTHCYEDRGSYGDMMVAQLANLPEKLVKLYLDIDDILNSPSSLEDRHGKIAPIVIMAYPSPVPSEDRYDEVLKACGQFIAYPEWKWIIRFHDKLIATIDTAVKEARDLGVPIYFAVDGADAFEPSHTICDNDRYVNSIDKSDIGSFLVEAGYNHTRWMWFGVLASKYLFRADHSAERKKNQTFHPNALGYQAWTAALVKWSISDAAQNPVVRKRPAPLGVKPIPTAGPLKVAQLDGTSLMVNSSRLLTVDGLQAGSNVTAIIQSRPQELDRAFADDSGVAYLVITLPEDFPIGEHTLTVAGFKAVGTPFSNSYPIRVTMSRSILQRITLPIGLASAILALGSGAILLMRRRRSKPDQPTQSPAPEVPPGLRSHRKVIRDGETSVEV